MTKPVKKIERIKFTDEYGEPHQNAEIYIYNYRGYLAIGGDAEEGDATYQAVNEYEKFSYCGSVYTSPAAKASGKRTRPMRHDETEDGSYSLVFNADITTPEAKQILASSLDQDEKVLRVCEADVRQRAKP